MNGLFTWDCGAGFSYALRAIVSRWAMPKLDGPRYWVAVAGRGYYAVCDDFGNLVEVQ